MEDQPQRRSWGLWGTVGLLAVVYPLSVGPVIAMIVKGYLPAWFGKVPLYWPIQWVRDQNKWVDQACGDYIWWWTGPH